jgi:hypothetical protein
MNESPEDVATLVDNVESAIEDINSAVIAASELDYAEIALWLEWIAEELDDLLRNIVQLPTADEVPVVEPQGL